MRQRFIIPPALLLCAALLWGCTAGQAASSRPEPELEEQQSAEELEAHTARDSVLRVGYFAREGYNPYLSDNQYLRQTASLVFQNLVDIGPDMALRYGAAGTVAVAGTEVAITLRAGLRFSNGEAATGEDLAASLLAAVQSGAYAARFANVAEVQYEGEGDTVAVTLAEPDPLFAYLLDIPLLQAGEVESRTPHAASGRFAYSEAEHALLPNAYYAGEGAATAVERVALVDVAGYDELLAAMGAGSVDMFASEAEGAQASGTVALQAEYPLNHLVFIGFNRENSALEDAAVRAAVAELADRQAIATECYAERAYPATGLWNPLYGLAGELYQATAPADAANSLAAALEAAGFARTGGGYTGPEGEALSLRLLVYTGSAGKWAAANALAEALRTVGLDVALDEETDFAQYSTKIAEGDFELYIGELKLYNNMDFSQLFGGEETGVALDGESALAEAFAGYKAGEVSPTALQAAFGAETSFVPLVWRTGTVYHTKRVSGFTASVSDMLYEAQALEFTA